MPNTLPYLGAALVCERVIEEADGANTLIRIVDTFHLRQQPNAPAGATPSVRLTVYLGLKSGDVKGDFTLSLELRSPSGEIHSLIAGQPVTLKGGDQGLNVIAHLDVPVLEYGLHWIDVRWGDQILTAIPVKLLLASDSSSKVLGAGR